MDLLTHEIIEQISIIKLNRPEKRNSVNPQLAQELRQAALDFNHNPKLKVLILSGNGDNFCAGADLSEAPGLLNSPGSDEFGPMGFTRMAFLSKPCIAAIPGYRVAGGMELAAVCDFRIAEKSSKFGILNRRFGVPLIDGGTQRLAKIVGLSNALYLSNTGLLINSEKAEKMGFVQEITENGQSLNRAIELAKLMCGFPQTCMNNDRKAIYQSFAKNLNEGIQMEKELHIETINSPEIIMGLKKFSDKDW